MRHKYWCQAKLDRDVSYALDARPSVSGVSACRAGQGRRPRGFVLLEVLVALTLLALVLTPLAAMTFRIANRSHRIVGASYRNAVLLDEVNYLSSLPYDSLPSGTVTGAVNVDPYPHTRKVIFTDVWSGMQGKMKLVKIIITPTNPLYKPDTAIFMRSRVNKSELFTIDDP
jgi:prepilin-type N-terminal cleavage/methylation domain-containing protein